MTRNTLACPRVMRAHNKTNPRKRPAQIIEVSSTLLITMNPQKRKTPASADTEALRPLKVTRLTRRPRTGTRPMVTMLLGNETKTPVTVLLDSGCTTPIISATLVAKLCMRCYRHDKPLQIRAFDGTIVQGAGQDFTPPLNLQHRAHYTKEVFQVATLDLSSDILLPFWWISECHKPPVTCSSEQVTPPPPGGSSESP